MQISLQESAQELVNDSITFISKDFDEESDLTHLPQRKKGTNGSLEQSSQRRLSQQRTGVRVSEIFINNRITSSGISSSVIHHREQLWLPHPSLGDMSLISIATL
jgi:hypothetical protein